MNDLNLPDWQDLPRVVTWFDNIRGARGVQANVLSGLAGERAVSAFCGRRKSDG